MKITIQISLSNEFFHQGKEGKERLYGSSFSYEDHNGMFERLLNLCMSIPIGTKLNVHKGHMIYFLPHEFEGIKFNHLSFPIVFQGVNIESHTNHTTLCFQVVHNDLLTDTRNPSSKTDFLRFVWCTVIRSYDAIQLKDNITNRMIEEHVSAVTRIGVGDLGWNLKIGFVGTAYHDDVPKLWDMILDQVGREHWK